MTLTENGGESMYSWRVSNYASYKTPI
jgi:hypothetical protein